MESKNENKNMGLLLMILAVCFGFAFYLFYELIMRPSKANNLADKINNGFEEDKRNIARYWDNVKSDLRTAYEKNTR